MVKVKNSHKHLIVGLCVNRVCMAAVQDFMQTNVRGAKTTIFEFGGLMRVKHRYIIRGSFRGGGQGALIPP